MSTPSEARALLCAQRCHYSVKCDSSPTLIRLRRVSGRAAEGVLTDGVARGAPKPPPCRVGTGTEPNSPRSRSSGETLAASNRRTVGRGSPRGARTTPLVDGIAQGAHEIVLCPSNWITICRNYRNYQSKQARRWPAPSGHPEPVGIHPYLMDQLGSHIGKRIG